MFVNYIYDTETNAMWSNFIPNTDKNNKVSEWEAFLPTLKQLFDTKDQR